MLGGAAANTPTDYVAKSRQRRHLGRQRRRASRGERMQLKLNRALCASTALVTGLLMASGALAQSTANQVQELVVTGAHGQPTVAGVITQVQEAKDVSVVNHEFFEHQTAGENFAQLINLLPGVTYTSEDAYGNLSGDLHIHGFDGA